MSTALNPVSLAAVEISEDDANDVLALALAPLPMTVANIKAASKALTVDATQKKSVMIKGCAEYLLNEGAVTASVNEGKLNFALADDILLPLNK